MSSMRPSFFMPVVLLVLAACSSPPPIHTATAVDLERFMGDWYVIANIPTFIETNAYNAMESYRLAGDGTVATTFSFREGGFEGARKTYHPTGYRMPSGVCSSSGRSSQTIASSSWMMPMIRPSSAGYSAIMSG